MMRMMSVNSNSCFPFCTVEEITCFSEAGWNFWKVVLKEFTAEEESKCRVSEERHDKVVVKGCCLDTEHTVFIWNTLTFILDFNLEFSLPKVVFIKFSLLIVII